MGKIFYLMGKSASGKDKIYKTLMKSGLPLNPLVIYTTRPMRSGEEEGKQYHFIDEGRLGELEAEGAVIERRDYDTVLGIWSYATVDDGKFTMDGPDFLAIGTLESFEKVRDHYGKENIIPLYIETDDLQRLERAIKREKKQDEPNFIEVCRRFVADSEDFSEDKLNDVGIKKRFLNNDTLKECVGEIEDYISSMI